MDALARSWKLFVATAAVIGAIGFFKPFCTFQPGGFELSAWRMLVGYNSLAEVPFDTGIAPEQMDTELASERLREINDVVKTDWVTLVSRSGFIRHETTSPRNLIPLVLGSALVLLFCVGIYALVERQLSTVAAWVALLAALPAVWAFVRAWRVISNDPTLELAQGGYLLGLAAALATIGGVGGVFKDDPGGIFRNVPRDEDVLVEELEDPHGRRTRRDPRDL